MSRTALIIANPAAGFKAAGVWAEQATKRLTQLGLRAELHRTQGRGDAERAARSASGQFDIVLAAGGDGTLHEVANGLAGSPTAMGLLPLGSMNILARELGMPLKVLDACQWLARSEPAPIALGLRDDRYFVIMAGIGYDAFCLEAALRRANAGGRKVRRMDYVVAATLEARRYGFPAVIAEEGSWAAEGAFAFVANCPRYGANLRIARRARLNEPRLDLVMFHSGVLRDRIRYLLEVIAGRVAASSRVTYRKVEQVRLRSGGDLRVPCQLDGETSAPLPAVVRVAPDALLLLSSAR